MNWLPISEVEGLQNAIESLMVGSERWSEQTPRHKQDRVVLRDGDCRLIVNWIERMMSERDSGFALAEQFESQISEACEITPPSDGDDLVVEHHIGGGTMMMIADKTTEPDWRIDAYASLLREIGKLVGVSNLDERLPIAVADALKSSTSIESSLAEALEAMLSFSAHPLQTFGSKRMEWVAARDKALAALAMRQAGGKEGGGES